MGERWKSERQLLDRIHSLRDRLPLCGLGDQLGTGLRLLELAEETLETAGGIDSRTDKVAARFRMLANDAAEVLLVAVEQEA